MAIQISEIFVGGHEVTEVASFLFAGCWGMIFFKAPKEALSLCSPFYLPLDLLPLCLG